MTEDLEARIKALEEQLIPNPDKISTMKATNRLKQKLDELKKDKESQEDVVWKLIHFYEFYMGYFDAMRHPERVSISKKEGGYSMLIDLKSPYCGYILKMKDIEFE